MRIIESILTQNPCYTAGRKIEVKGLMLHSVGCPQPSASVFVRNWNSEDFDSACVHAFIDALNGDIYQTLPWNHRGWHGGGSSNNTHIGVEMCEPACISYTGGASFTCSDVATARECVKRTYNSAVELFAYLCREYGLNPFTDICSHSEGAKKGIASNHADVEHLWNGLQTGYTMDGFRQDVANAIGTVTPEQSTEMYRVRTSWDDDKSQIGAFKVLENAKSLADSNVGYSVYNSTGQCVYTPTLNDGTFLVQVSITDLNIRTGPGYKVYDTIGFCPVGVYTIVETRMVDGYTWGRLKSGSGWIALEYTERI